MASDSTVQVPAVVAQWLADVQRAAYQKGWKDATQAMLSAASAAAENRAAPLPARQQASQQHPSPFRSIGLLVNGVAHSERVATALRENPGMRPREIAKWIQRTEPGVKTRGIETAVKRMRKNGLVIERHTKLYLVQKTGGQQAA